MMSHKRCTTIFGRGHILVNDVPHQFKDLYPYSGSTISTSSEDEASKSESREIIKGKQNGDDTSNKEEEEFFKELIKHNASPSRPAKGEIESWRST